METMKCAWLLRVLSTDNALTTQDLIRLSGWSERTILRGLAELRERDEVITLRQDDYDHGDLPSVHMKTHDVYRMRVGNHVLKEKAAPKMASERARVMRLRNEYIARQINKRKERERREQDNALR